MWPLWAQSHLAAPQRADRDSKLTDEMPGDPQSPQGPHLLASSSPHLERPTWTRLDSHPKIINTHPWLLFLGYDGGCQSCLIKWLSWRSLETVRRHLEHFLHSPCSDPCRAYAQASRSSGFRLGWRNENHRQEWGRERGRSSSPSHTMAGALSWVSAVSFFLAVPTGQARRWPLGTPCPPLSLQPGDGRVICWRTMVRPLIQVCERGSSGRKTTFPGRNLDLHKEMETSRNG